MILVHWVENGRLRVPSAEGNTGLGYVDVEKLCKFVEFFAEKGYPVLLIFNYGTTLKVHMTVCRKLVRS